MTDTQRESRRLMNQLMRARQQGAHVITAYKRGAVGIVVGRSTEADIAKSARLKKARI